MNAIYKVIWNDAIRQYQVVNELCRSRRKACSVKAVHVESVSGAHSVVSSLKRGAVLAGSALTMLVGWGGVQATPVDIDGSFAWNLGTGQIEGSFDYSSTPIDQLPGTGESFTVHLDGDVTLTGVSDSIYAQDEVNGPSSLILVDFDYIANLGGADPSVVFRHEDGTISNELTSSTELARFTYELGAGFSSSSGWSIGLTRQLKKIELLSQQGAGQYILVSNQEDVKLNDLSALITGNGNITFGFSAEEQGQEGWITLNNFDELDESKTNDYYGVTRVGYNDQGVASDIVHLVFGKTEALGNTSLLNVQTNSEVLVGGKDGDKAYSQNVGALSGAGTIALGSFATLNLNQSTQTGDITEPVGDEPGKINIANQFTGGNGATVNISLTGDPNSNGVSGYEVVFEPGKTQQGLFTGLISLAGGSVSAYKDVGINEILLDSTLKLNNEGWVRVDSTGQINNLISLLVAEPAASSSAASAT